MKTERLITVGMDRAVGYQIKEGGDTICLFRWNETYQCWIDLKNPSAHRTEAGAVRILTALEAAGYGELMGFGCCCADCHNEDNKAAAKRFHKTTGDFMSHGHWPDHATAELNRVMAQMDSELKSA